MQIREANEQEDITILNTCAPNISTPEIINQTLLNVKQQRDLDTLIVDLNFLLS
jgi:hypothetical protein